MRKLVLRWLGIDPAGRRKLDYRISADSTSIAAPDLHRIQREADVRSRLNRAR